MKKFQNILKPANILILSLLFFMAFSVNVDAAEKNSPLPEGWKYLSERTLSSKHPAQAEKDLLRISENIISRIPAPSLTSVQILGFAIDEKNKIHIAIKEMGTSKTRNVYWNGSLCPENTREEQFITQGNIVVGYIRYFDIGLIYSKEVIGRSGNASATYINAMSPFNQIGASKVLVIPEYSEYL